jgi:hypothetical protein
MYLLIRFQFNVYDVSLVPKISKCLRNERLESLPDMEMKLKYIHSLELWDAIMEIINMLTFVNTINIDYHYKRLVRQNVCCLHIIWLLLEISFTEIPTRKMLIFVLPQLLHQILVILRTTP